MAELGIYDRRRFIVITNCPYGELKPLREASEQVHAIEGKYLGKDDEKESQVHDEINQSLSMSDVEIIEKASSAKNGEKFLALHRDGNTSNHGGDDSSADLALMTILAFYTQDTEQLERLFSESNLGKREKWKRKDYRVRTIDKALKSLKDTYKKRESSTEDLQKIFNTAKQEALLNKLNLDGLQQYLSDQFSFLSDVQRVEISEKALNWAKNYLPGCEVVLKGVAKRITDMSLLDVRFAQLEASGSPCVFISRPDAQPISSQDYYRRTSSEVVVSDVGVKDEVKYIPASAFWAGSCRKKIYTKIAFTGEKVGDDTLNLFTGFGVIPKQGDCTKILSHIREVICAGKAVEYEAFIKLLSWQIKNIGKPSRVVICLKSEDQQVGKGALVEDILAKIYGNSGFTTNDIDKITGRFNDAIRGRAFIFLEEALFSGNRKASDSIKALVTATTLSVETKGLPVVQVPIAVNVFMNTNHSDAAYIEKSDARYWVLEVSPHRKGDTQYFAELYKEIESGGREAFMYELLHMDVSNFFPARDVPMNNDSKKDMIRNSINPYDVLKWIEDCCRTEALIGYEGQNIDLPWVHWESGKEYQNSVFSGAYANWQKTVKTPIGARPTPSNKFGNLLTALGFECRIEGGKRYRKLPNLSECLQKVLEMMGGES